MTKRTGQILNFLLTSEKKSQWFARARKRLCRYRISAKWMSISRTINPRFSSKSTSKGTRPSSIRKYGETSMRISIQVKKAPCSRSSLRIILNMRNRHNNRPIHIQRNHRIMWKRRRRTTQILLSCFPVSSNLLNLRNKQGLASQQDPP